MAYRILGVVLAVAAIWGVACARSPVAPNPGADGSPQPPPGIPGYEAIDLGTLGGSRTLPSAINDNGSIVGTSETADGRFLCCVYEGAEMRTLRA